MPILALLIVALAAGLVVTFAFDRFAPAQGATAAVADAVEEAAEQSALRTWWRARTDPAVSTGLALTAAVALMIASGVVDRRARAADPRQRDDGIGRLERGPLGQRARDAHGNPRPHLDHRSRQLAGRAARRAADRRLRAAPRAQPLARAVPARRPRGQQAHHDRHQGSRRPRPADAQPRRPDARPVVPERAFLDRGGVLRGARAHTRPRSPPPGARPARRHRRRDRDRGRREPRPARRALALGRDRRRPARLGVVRALGRRLRRPARPFRRADGAAAAEAPTGPAPPPAAPTTAKV